MPVFTTYLKYKPKNNNSNLIEIAVVQTRYKINIAIIKFKNNNNTLLT